MLIMVTALRHRVTVKQGGRIEFSSGELQEGWQAEVIVLLEQGLQRKSYLNLFGSGKGAFTHPGEVDNFLRKERDSWKS